MHRGPIKICMFLKKTACNMLLQENAIDRGLAWVTVEAKS
jgi:hypothetical protein